MTASTSDRNGRRQIGALRTWLASGVRRRRRDQNWTQRELARRAGVSRTLLNRFERGGNASLEVLGRIVDAAMWEASRDVVDGPPAIVLVRMLLLRRLRGVYGRLGRLLITLEDSEEVDDHASA